MTGRVGLLAIAAAVSVSTACRGGLDRFDTGPNEAYCGSIVSAGIVRAGIKSPDLRMRARIDTGKLSSVPGTLATGDADDPFNPCAPSPRLDEAPMRASEAVLHDPLSTFDFGTGRDHNFFAWVDSTCDGPYLAVVSLMRNDDVEVRLMKPRPEPSAEAPSDAGADAGAASDSAEAPGFALFPLERRKGDCGF